MAVSKSSLAKYSSDRSAKSESPANLAAVDSLLEGAGLRHGTRSGPGWARERSPRGGGDQAPRDHSAGRPSAVARPGEIDVVQVPGWAEMDWLLHGFSTRTGGLTTAYLHEAEGRSIPQPGELNLGFTQSDPDKNVLRNRASFLAAVYSAGPAKAAAKKRATKPPALVTLKQIHSSLTRRVGRAEAAERALLKGDGLMTAEPGVTLGILTADCIPILIADRRQRAVAAFHAGWRGTLKRIVESGVGRMKLEFGSRPEDLVAAIGPGIGQCCYAVGEEVRREFDSQFRYAGELFCEIYDSDPVREKYPLLFLTARAPGHSPIGPSMHLDLVEANKRQLLDAGLKPEAIYVAGECTSCRRDRYFSHRADHGFTGRMMSVIGIR